MRVSNSRIQCYKSCHRMYELKYIYGVVPVQTSEALERGYNYHKAIETGEEPDDIKTAAMVDKWRDSFDVEMSEKEKEFEYKTARHTVWGRVDGLTLDGKVVEHKTAANVDGAYLLRLDIDEQIPTYMLGMKTNSVVYDVMQTPGIRQKKDETDEEFRQRCYDSAELTVVTVTKPQEELDEFLAEQDEVIEEMKNRKVFYRNPNHCMKWGRLCEYAPICKRYNPDEEYIGFIKTEVENNGD